MTSQPCDVAIIGAGLAGLTAARELMRAGVDRVVVLEARGRVGGRTLNQPIPGGEIVEGGGEFVGPTQTAVTALARELGLAIYPTYSDGQTVYSMGGSRWTAADFGVDAALSPGTPGERLDKMALEVPIDRPWDAPRATAWDAMTVGDWTRESDIGQAERLLIDLGTAATLGAAPGDLSLLWFLFYIHSAGGLKDLLSTRGGAQDSRIAGGSQLISLRMAEQLGARLGLSSPVRRISEWDTGAVRVEHDEGMVEAERVIVAMMPKDVTRIEFDPPLPEPRRRLNESWGASEVGFKAQLVYETAFWRAEGLSGQVLSDEEPQITFDNSPPRGSPGVIMAFVDPRRVVVGDRQAWLTGRMTHLFGEKAARPIAYVECDWHDDGWTAGCVSPLRPGVLTSYGPALTRPCGALHWAGTETSAVWNGYMDGAVRSGQRVAHEVLAARRNAPVVSGALG